MVVRSWESWFCTSIRLSHACFVTKPNYALWIFWYHTIHERAITLDFWHQQWLVGDAPSSEICPPKWPTPFEKRRLHNNISAYNVSGVRDSEKSSILMNRKSTTGFPTSHRWNAYVTPKSVNGWLKKRFLCVFKKTSTLIE